MNKIFIPGSSWKHWQCWCGYLSSLGVFVTVVSSSYSEHILHTVIKLREAIELTVAEVDGSLKSKALKVSFCQQSDLLKSEFHIYSWLKY